MDAIKKTVESAGYRTDDFVWITTYCTNLEARLTFCVVRTLKCRALPSRRAVHTERRRLAHFVVVRFVGDEDVAGNA